MALWQSKCMVTRQGAGTAGKINLITIDSADSVFEESDHSDPIKPVQDPYFHAKKKKKSPYAVLSPASA